MSEFEGLSKHGRRSPPAGGLDAAIARGTRRRRREQTVFTGAASLIALVVVAAVLSRHHSHGPTDSLTAGKGGTGNAVATTSPSPSPRPSSNTTGIILPPGTSTRTPTDPTKPIKIYLIDGSGNPVSGAFLTDLDHPAACDCGVATAADGSVMITPKVDIAAKLNDVFFLYTSPADADSAASGVGTEALGSRVLDCAVVHCVTGMRVTLPTAGQLHATFKGALGQPLAGLKVKLGWSGPTTTLTTDRDGVVEFASLGPGRYSLTAIDAVPLCSTHDWSVSDLAVVSGERNDLTFVPTCQDPTPSASPSP